MHSRERSQSLQQTLGVMLLWLICAGPVAAQATQTNTDWQVICDAEGCRMAQSLIAEAGQKPVMSVRIFANPQPTMLISLPLGIFLKPGLLLQIDDNTAESHAFEICDANGCHAGILLEDGLLTRMRKGQLAFVEFQDNQRRPIRLPVSLSGFTAAYQQMSAP